MSEQENALTVVQNTAPAVTNIWADGNAMSMALKSADMLAKAGILPQSYRGNPGDCLIALDIANRMGLSPVTVMQYSQVVQGNFTWKGTACKALIDNCGKFRRSRYEVWGKEGTPERGCRLVAERISTGETVQGPSVTLKMAQDERWGPKWKTIPELMLRYRAASFFAKTECPEVLMGFQTAEETGDVLKVDPYAPEPETVNCTDCGQEIGGAFGRSAEWVVNYTKKNYGGAPLCAECAQKRKEAARAAEVQEQAGELESSAEGENEGADREIL